MHILVSSVMSVELVLDLDSLFMDLSVSKTSNC